jgi:hypothetical protein
MNYSRTTHWPRRADEAIELPHQGVWVQDNQWNLISRVAAGDLVFIYEHRSGPVVIRNDEAGFSRMIARRVGREGVVALVEIIQPAYEREHSPTRTLF